MERCTETPVAPATTAPMDSDAVAPAGGLRPCSLAARDAIRREIDRSRDEGLIARVLGVNERTMVRALAGLPVTAGTRAQIHLRLGTVGYSAKDLGEP